MKLTQKYKVTLPVGAVSPTNSIYRKFDIVHQTKVVTTFTKNPRMVRSLEPFTLSVLVGDKVRLLESKLDSK